MAGKSTRLVAIGVAIFAVSATAAFLLLRTGDSSAGTTPPAKTAPKTMTSPAPESAPANGVVRTAPNRPGFTIPKGFEAVQISVRGAPAVSGYVVPNDLVNVYATVKGDPKRSAYARELISGARVLDIVTPPPGTDGDTVFLLALRPREAARLIFTAKFESVWVTLARPDQQKARTGRQTYANVF